MKHSYFLLYLFSLLLLSCQKETIDYDSAVRSCVPDTMYLIGENDTIKSTYIDIHCIVGAQLPSFSSVTMDNVKIDSSYFSDRVSVINFWFEGCQPCEAEMPGLNKLVEKYKTKEVNFLAIGRNSPKDISDFLLRKPFNFEHIAYGEPIIRGPFQCTWGYPVTIVVDRNSKIIYAESGGITDSTAIEIIQKKLIPVIDGAL
jgi:thiol-disulfide isomerase/thioredoxin